MYGRRGNRTRNRIYIISALLVIGVVIAFIYGNHPFGKSESPSPPVLTDVNTGAIEVPPAVEPVKPVIEPVKPAAGPAKPEPEPAPTLIEVAPGPTIESNPEVAKLINEAVALIGATPSKVMEARVRLNEALPMPMSEQQREFVKGQLSQLADKWLFSRSVFPGDSLCGTYKVKAGDQLRNIGRQFKVPYALLMRINNIARPEALQAGETIKVIQGPFNARVYRSTFTMDLYLQSTFVRSFRVGLGKPGMETPMGLWVAKLGGKLIKPVWTDPITSKTYHPEDPDYPLGSRWIGLEGVEGAAKGRTGFAIHGTQKPEEIGTAGSQGCIRLHNGNVKLVYDLLEPGFSRVEVVE
jgi:LysM repeat protein